MKHFFLRDAKGFPVACIASAIVDADDVLSDGPPQPGSQVAFALSIFNPGDHFNRKLAREIATNRLKAGRFTKVGLIRPVKQAILNSVIHDFKILTHGEAARPPERVIDAATYWLSQHIGGMAQPYRGGKNDGERPEAANS